jgi:hypothetical protein
MFRSVQLRSPLFRELILPHLIVFDGGIVDNVEESSTPTAFGCEEVDHGGSS